MLHDVSSFRVSTLFPNNVDQLKELIVALDDVKDEHFGLILSSFCAVYIFKQSFAIPGSVLLVCICVSEVCKISAFIAIVLCVV